MCGLHIEIRAKACARSDCCPDDKPDTSSIKAFFCTADQGVNYHAGTWRKCFWPKDSLLHRLTNARSYTADHPMLTVGGSIDFACVETQIGHRADPRDCELIEYEQSVGIVDIPDF